MQHPLLQVQEILSNIFAYIASNPVLLALLARTCRAFKEPALNVLWSDLKDLSPISRCLPEVSVKHVRKDPEILLYGFDRLLEPAELNVLKGYTRRVRHIHDFCSGLDWTSVGRCIDIPSTNSLFPNLQFVCCQISQEIFPLLSLPLPSLKSLVICSQKNENIRTCRDFLDSLAKFSPNVTKLLLKDFRRRHATGKIISNHIPCWPSLEKVSCPGVDFTVDVLAHLSDRPALTWLALAVDAIFLNQQAIPNSPFTFSNLLVLQLNSAHLASVSRFLSHTRFPALTSFTADVDKRPPKLDFYPLLAGLESCCIGREIHECCILQQTETAVGSDTPDLDLGDLDPLMIFTHLRTVKIDFEWNVGLNDDDLLALALSWPRLEKLHINERWGWRINGGITPNGLVRLLQECPLLSSFALAIDTRGFTKLPPHLMRSSLRLEALPGRYYINVIDSHLEEKSISAMAAFFAAIVPHFNFHFAAHRHKSVFANTLRAHQIERWNRVYTQANGIITRRLLKLVEEQIFFPPDR